MSTLSQNKLRKLHAAGESSMLDYKREYNLQSDTGKNELAKDSCAIGNFLFQTSGRGFLIIGTDNASNPIGIKHSEYKEERLQQILSRRTDPPPTCIVHHVQYSGKDLTVLEFRRNWLGPHQVITHGRPAGFPIRRGSTTDMMSTNEVFQSMQSRGRSFKRQRSEYETLSPGQRYQIIRDELAEGLTELGISANAIRTMSYSGHGHTSHLTHPPRKFMRINKTINSRNWNIYFSIHDENASKRDLFGVDGSIGGFVEERSLPKHRSIFIHIIHGTISSSYFSSRQKGSFPLWGGPFVRVGIEPRITYFGAGVGVVGKLDFDVYLPKFFVSNIKSKEDMKTRIEIILRWIEQHPQMFEDIRNAYSP